MMARKNWGDARAEMLALMPEINKLISVGIKHVKIYQMMQAEHNLKCSLRTFRRWVRKYSDGQIQVSPKSASETRKPLRTGIPPTRNYIDDREETHDGPIVVRAALPEFKLHD